jgi:precorrin-6B methylase 2
MMAGYKNDKNKVWAPEDEASDDEPENPFETMWMEGDSLAPPCQAELDVIDAILDLVTPSNSDHVWDLGCGDGRIPLRAHSVYGCHSTGVEIESTEVAKFYSNIKQGIKDKTIKDGYVSAIQGDLREQDLTSATIVITYLLPDAMRAIEPKLVEVLERGGKVVANTWGLETVRPVKQHRQGNTTILLYGQ